MGGQDRVSAIVYASLVIAALAFSARFWRILAKTLFFEGNHSFSVYKGKICLENRQFHYQNTYYHTPVPPSHQLFYLVFFVRIFEKFENAGIKPLRVHGKIGPRECLRGRQCKASLYKHTSPFCTPTINDNLSEWRHTRSRLW